MLMEAIEKEKKYYIELGEKRGEKMGEQKGRMLEKLSIARALLLRDYSIEEICKITELPEKTVLKLKNELQ